MSHRLSHQVKAEADRSSKVKAKCYDGAVSLSCVHSACNSAHSFIKKNVFDLDRSSHQQRLLMKTDQGEQIKESTLSPLTCSGCHTPDCSIHCPSHGSEPLQGLDQGQGLLETGNPQCSSDTLTGGGKNPGEKRDKIKSPF